MNVVEEIKEETVQKQILSEHTSKYLTFVLGEEEYGLEILKVREIIGIMEITSVPQTPEFIKGVINLRGKVIPVVDLRRKFGMETAEYTEETCIIVVDIAESSMGILVDTVSEVLDIPQESIEPPPSFGSSINTEFILGMGKIKGKVKILLDINKVLSTKDLTAISNVVENNQEE